MPGSPARTFHYIRSWLTGRDDLVSGELALDREGTEVPATFLTPRACAPPLPAWIVLHGITRPGREHAQLVRFTRALAAGGCAVLVPEVPEWRRLDLAPATTLPTIVASLRALEARDDIDGGRVGLAGFSFGSPQAIAASAHPDLRDRLAGVVGFGGYCDLERTVLFQVTGRHEWEGRELHLRPDPYGRWIVAANYLTAIPGLEDCAPVADGLRRLATAAGDRGVMSWDERLDPIKEEVRAGLGPGRGRDVFELLAPGGGGDAAGAEAVELAHALAGAARRVDPAIEPGPVLALTTAPVHLMHGLRDHLIPFTEMLRLAALLPQGVVRQATVTRLFAHSRQDPFPGVVEGARETARFVRALSQLLGVV
jgi:pimeloyl-ACP methyl ester carboxylesterase